jgi:hypothetical protein
VRSFTGFGWAYDRIALFRVSRAATRLHVGIMRGYFPRHDWSKDNPIWTFLTASRGRDRITSIAIKLHNLLEWRHHGPSRSLESLREKIFDVIFARLEHMRDPLMPSPRQSVAELRQELADGTLVRSFVDPREIHGSLRRSYDDLEAFVDATCDEALAAAEKVEWLLRASNPQVLTLAPARYRPLSDAMTPLRPAAAG